MYQVPFHSFENAENSVRGRKIGTVRLFQWPQCQLIKGFYAIENTHYLRSSPGP